MEKHIKYHKSMIFRMSKKVVNLFVICAILCTFIPATYVCAAEIDTTYTFDDCIEMVIPTNIADTVNDKFCYFANSPVFGYDIGRSGQSGDYALKVSAWNQDTLGGTLAPFSPRSNEYSFAVKATSDRSALTGQYVLDGDFRIDHKDVLAVLMHPSGGDTGGGTKAWSDATDVVDPRPVVYFYNGNLHLAYGQPFAPETDVVIATPGLGNWFNLGCIVTANESIRKHEFFYNGKQIASKEWTNRWGSFYHFNITITSANTLAHNPTQAGEFLYIDNLYTGRDTTKVLPVIDTTYTFDKKESITLPASGSDSTNDSFCFFANAPVLDYGTGFSGNEGDYSLKMSAWNKDTISGTFSPFSPRSNEFSFAVKATPDRRKLTGTYALNGNFKVDHKDVIAVLMHPSISDTGGGTKGWSQTQEQLESKPVVYFYNGNLHAGYAQPFDPDTDSILASPGLGNWFTLGCVVTVDGNNYRKHEFFYNGTSIGSREWTDRWGSFYHFNITVASANTTAHNPTQAGEFLYIDNLYFGRDLRNVPGYYPSISVNSVVPANNATEVTDSKMTFNFTEPVKISTFESAFSISPAVDYKVKWSNKNKTVNVYFDSVLKPDTKYSISLRNTLKSAEDKAMAIEFKSNFTTASNGIKKYSVFNHRKFSNGQPSEGFSSGTFKIKTDIYAHCESQEVTAILAQYNNNKLVAVNIEPQSVGGESMTEVSLELSDEESTHLKYFLFEKDKLVPVCEPITIKPYSKTEIESVVKLFPGFTSEAATFSFDDGVNQDIQTIESLNKYGAKATFNVVAKTGDGSEDRLFGYYADYGATEQEKIDFIKNLYNGHELANHGYTHNAIFLDEGETYTAPTYKLYGITLEEAVAEITNNHNYIKEKFNIEMSGIAWPYRDASEREDFDVYKELLKEAGYKYARQHSTSTWSFDLPDDWMRWSVTSHIKNITQLTNSLVEQKENGKLKLMYLWGHSYEHEDPEEYGWDLSVLEANLSKMKDANVWFATNAEVVDYVNALDAIVYNTDTVTNNSEIDVYLMVNGKKLELKAGETYHIN